MARFSKILAPVEFSPRCLGSAQYAEALACHFHCEITILHVIKPPYAAYSVPDVAAYAGVVDLESELLNCAKAQLDAFPDPPPAQGHLSRVVLEGDPACTIVDYARDGRFDLIVMPTHGYSPWRRLLLGSVTAKVLHYADCPLWTGSHLDCAPAGDTLRFHTVVCAVESGEESGAVLDWGASLARE